MKENKYDDPVFFDQYSRMSRSVKGLEGAGEWHALQLLLPDFHGKRVLDLGCGFGWHCQYAAAHGAKSVVGIDISEKMLEVACSHNQYENVTYVQVPVEDYDYQSGAFDIVLSSLTFHYLESFGDISRKISQCLVSGGDFVFSVEHPVFTAKGDQDWYYNEQGERLHWPVDNYFIEGEREAVFLGEKIIKYHRTLTTYIKDLNNSGFQIRTIMEPEPAAIVLEQIPEMREELRRPMMLLIAARKNIQTSL